jgi:hypothetical protein
MVEAGLWPALILMVAVFGAIAPLRPPMVAGAAPEPFLLAVRIVGWKHLDFGGVAARTRRLRPL